MKKQLLILLVGCSCCCGFAAEDAPPSSGDGKSINDQAKFELPGSGSVGIGGSYTFSYPISGAPGRSGLSRKTGLSYNSAHLSDQSLVGYGWNIPMMAVQRNSRFGVDQLYTTNSFYTAPGAGELILVSDGAVQEYRARIEGGFVRWFYDTSAASWCSYDRDGVKTTYGSSDASRVADTNTTAHIYAWYVERIEDIYGNFVRFDYWKDEGEIYPREIVYTGNGTDDGLSSIRFQPFYKGPILHSYYMRPDMTISYDAGFKTQRRFRLNAVEAYAGDDLASRYELSYTNGSTDVRSLLHSITRIGNDGTNAMPSSTFEYQTPKFDALPETHTNYFLPEGLHLLTFQPGATNEVPGDGGVRFEDINGDSLPDLLYANGCTNENNRGVWLNTGSGWKKSEEWELPSDSNLWFVAYVDEDQTPDSTGVTVSDVNGDGRADILMAQSYIDSSGDWVDRRHVWLNTGSNWVEDTSWTFPTNIAFLGSFSSNGTDQVLLDLNVQMPDLNGDGYPDLVYSVTNQTSATSLSGGHLPMTNAVWLNTGNGWVATDGWVLPDGHSLMADLKNDGSSAPRDGSLRFIDLNGDGLADLLYANGHQWGYEGSATASGRTKKAWLNTGSGWERNDQWNLPEYNTGYQGQDYDFAWFQADHPYFYFGGSSVSSPFTVGLRMKDVNGDGLPDLILSQLYNYSAFTSATNWSDLCTNHCAEIDCATNVCATSDCNWDCEDCDYACESNCLFDIQACIAAGNDSNDCLRAYQTCLDAIIDCQQQKEACLVRQAECLLEKEACSNQVQECYNECTDYVQNSDGCFTDCMDLYLQLQDEQIYSAVWLNTGNGWIRNDDYLPAPESRVHFVGIYTNGNTMTVLDTRMNLMDLNGDGTPEYMADSSEPVLGLDDPRMVFSGVDGREMLVARHNPFGATETISYTSTVQTPDFKSPSGFRVVDSVLVEDGFGMAYPTFYDYSGGWFFVDSSGARRNQFRGFHQRSVVNAAGVRTVSYYHQGGGPDGSLQGEYNDTEAKKGSVYRTEIYGSNDMLYASTVTRWEQESYADGTEERWWPVKTLETSFSFTESGAHREAAVRSFCNPATGLTEEMHMLGEVSADPATGAVLSETVNDSDDETYVFTQYQSFSGIPYQYITGRPESIEVTSDPSGNTRLGLTEYSWFPDSSPQSVSRWLDTTGEMVVEQAFLDYDDYGNVTKARNAAGLVTEFTYDSTHHMYPVSISAGGRLTTMVTDSRSGKTLSVTDHSSGTVASNSYDTFFRPQTSWKDGVWQQTYEYHVGPAEGSGAQEIYTYVWVPGYWQEGWSSTSSENDIWIEGYWKPTPVEVVPGEDYAFDNHIYVKINTGSGIDGDAEQIVYADGLGRTIQTRIESERDDGAYRVSNTVYDEEGRITYAYEPRFETGLQYVPFNPRNPAVEYDYDALGRVAQTIPRAGDSGSPTAPTVTAYEEDDNPWVVIATDALGTVHKSCNDAYGRTIRVVDYPDGNPVETRYEYDLLGRLLRTVDPQENQIAVEYDSLGRKTGMNDPDMGIWQYGYDSAGRLTSQLDAVSNRIVFAYDEFSRVTTQWVYSAAGSLVDTVVHTYDAGDDAGFTVYTGQLYRTVQNGVTNRYSYDAHGNILKIETAIADVGTYTVTNSYDELDRPLSVGYPNQVAAVQYTLGRIGNLTGVSSLHGAGDDSMSFYTVGAFNELGQPDSVNYGNGVESRFSYYANSRRLRQSTTRRINGRAYQHLDYAYNAGGLITDINDYLRSGEESAACTGIQYDGLYRLKSVTYGGSASPTTYSYDTLGNILFNGETNQTYQYTGSRPHAVAQITDDQSQITEFAYDPNGNITNRQSALDSQQYVFDAYNRLTAVKKADGTEVRFRYLASGARYLKETVTAGQTNRTVYIGNAYEEQRFATGQTNQLCHVFFGGKRVCSFAPIPDGEQVAAIPLDSDELLASAASIGNRQSKVPLGIAPWCVPASSSATSPGLPPKPFPTDSLPSSPLWGLFSSSSASVAVQTRPSALKSKALSDTEGMATKNTKIHKKDLLEFFVMSRAFCG